MEHAPASPESLASVIADAHASATPLRIVGAGTWLSAGRPVAAAQRLSTRQLTGVLSYVPGDLVITVRSGTTLREIADVTAQHNQWLALEPYSTVDGAESGTIGATIATAAHGPLALGYGRARDLVLGLSFVAGDGTLARAGGQVVKNVAGFDLVRLATGAWGTLGVITQASLRLHARQPIDESFAIGFDMPDAPDARHLALARLTGLLNSAPLLASTSGLAALTLLSHETTTLFTSRGVPSAPLVLLARATGNRAKVTAQRAALSTLGDVTSVETGVWHDVRAFDRGDIVCRVTDAPNRLAQTLGVITRWLDRTQCTDVHVLMEPMRGAVRVACRARPERHGQLRLPDRTIGEVLPLGAWHTVPSAVDDLTSRRLRRAFDPAGILNPGILGASPPS